ncbi:MAG: transglycosylase domain-containing protein [Saprospiraceae bacterium]|nr:transglycosylase domain-containing protein [Saprospiraceae bacterium]
MQSPSIVKAVFYSEISDFLSREAAKTKEWVIAIEFENDIPKKKYCAMYLNKVTFSRCCRV